MMFLQQHAFGTVMSLHHRSEHVGFKKWHTDFLFKVPVQHQVKGVKLPLSVELYPFEQSWYSIMFEGLNSSPVWNFNPLSSLGTASC